MTEPIRRAMSCAYWSSFAYERRAELVEDLPPVEEVGLGLEAGDRLGDGPRPGDMEAKEIKIETIIGASLRLISGDADRLQQVVWNVLSNAAKFTPAGGKVEISVSQTGTHVQIQVKDSGPGIDPTFLPHVFERFRQADGNCTPSGRAAWRHDSS